MKKLALATAVLASVFAVSANAYQGEVGASLNYVDPDNGDSGTGLAVDGTYYFTPVQVKNGPLNEAAFLSQASNVNGSLSYSDNDGIKVTGINAGIEYYVPNSQFYVSGNVGSTNYDYDHGDSTSVTGYGAEVGFLPMPNLLVAAGVAGVKDDNDSSTEPTLRAKYVTNLASGNAVNLEAKLGFGDNNTYLLGGDFYLDQTTSVGAEYSGINYKDNNVTDTNTFSIRAKKFLNQQVSVEGNIGFGDNVNTYGVRGAYRF